MAIVFLLPPVLAFLICLPAVLVGIAFGVGIALGKKAAVIAAVVSLFFFLPFVLFFSYFKAVRVAARMGNKQQAEVIDESQGHALRNGRSPVPDVIVESPIAEPQDPAFQAFAALLSELKIFSDRPRPAWADQAPGLDHGVYRWPVKSGLYSTQEECRQALAVAVAQAVAQYGKTLLADPSAADVLLRRPGWLIEMQRSHPQFERGVDNSRANLKHTYHEPPKATVKGSGPSAVVEYGAFPEVTASGRTNLIEQPLYAETVEKSVGDMQQLHALLEFGDNARAQIREAWRQAAIPRRLRWAACGFAAVLATIAIVLAALRLDLASGGKHRRRLRWGTALTILLVACSACGLCLL